MDRLPQRDDLIYKEIEEFQDYELTNCIAYEMAIRSQNYTYSIEVINLDVISGIDLNNTDISDSDKNYLLDVIELSDYIKIFSNNKSNKLNFIEFLQMDEQIKSIMNETMNFEDRLNKYGKVECLKILNKKSKKEILNKLINPPKLNIKHSRPKIKINETSLFSIDLNLNLPKEELIAYISKIKDEYDKNNSIIKTPLELLGETLEKSDNKKIPKKPKASVYADWFYIYDYWKYEKALGKTDKEIFVALEIENIIPYKEDMIRKIRDKMKYFIDDLGYKELITGVKNS